MFYVTYKARFLLFSSDLLRVLSQKVIEVLNYFYFRQTCVAKTKYGRRVALWLPDRVPRLINNLKASTKAL